MIIYLMDLGFDIWKSIVTIYTTPMTPPTYETKNNPSENNANSMNSILCVLLEFNFFKVMHCGPSQENWDNIQNIHEGSDNVKNEKIQTHKRQLESLKMKDKENVASYHLCVDEIVNTIRGLG
jgi:hypothetical protein